MHLEFLLPVLSNEAMETELEVEFLSGSVSGIGDWLAIGSEPLKNSRFYLSSDHCREEVVFQFG